MVWYHYPRKNDWELEICEIDDLTTREVSFVKKVFQ